MMNFGKKKKKASSAVDDDGFIGEKIQKKWVDTQSGYISIMVYARSLYIVHGQSQWWNWDCYKETGEEFIEVAKLIAVCWFEVQGRLDISDLSPGIVYEVAYIVKLTKGASGWEIPINLHLMVSGREDQIRIVSFLNKPRGEWFELIIGTFKAEAGDPGEIYFRLFEVHELHWKSGLIIKGAIIRSKS